MTVSEPIGEERRFALIERLTELLGKEEARTLMESLPPVLWTHLATKDDLRALEERLRADFNGQFAVLNGKFIELRADFNGQFAMLNAKVDGGFANVEAAFKEHRAETTLQLAKQTRAMVITLIGFAMSVWIPMLIFGLS
ncbi:MAG: hypothetical protein KTV68_02095 [Acidimicrobiia bacterium]|nr:hypothetical protein [Acidimicrobiia bacterium]MCY4435293.1 hypothetical protein [bacterium]